MQIIVLSMHRSGSSVVTRLINMMGAYFGPEGSATRPNWENPKGFWERRDLRQLNDRILHSVDADWDRLSSFSLSSISEEKGRSEYQNDIKKILGELNLHLPWVIKEPRFCLLLPLWLDLLQSPIAVIPYRNPLEIAKSLNVRNKIPIRVALALWERYILGIVELACQLPHVFVRFEHLIEDPRKASLVLREQLAARGVLGLTDPEPEAVASFIDNKLYRQKAIEAELREVLSSEQRCLWTALRTHALDSVAGARLSENARSLLVQYEKDRYGAKIEHAKKTKLS